MMLPAGVPLNEQEWVEITNATNDRLNLRDLMLYDCPDNDCDDRGSFTAGDLLQMCLMGNQVFPETVSGYIIEPFQRIIIAEAAEVLPQDVPIYQAKAALSASLNAAIHSLEKTHLVWQSLTAQTTKSIQLSME